MNWTQLAPILHVRPTKWDDLHVWAPSIIWQDGIYYLFYAGVTYVPYPNTWYQRVGVATSDDVNSTTWMRYDAPVFGGNQVPWVLADSSQFAGCQFRDPFIMADSSQSNTWLMYYCATPRAATSQLITGIGTNGAGLAPWQDLKPMWNTDAAHFQGYTESPHVFKHAGRWYLFFTTNSGHPIRYQYSNVSATADSAGWIGTYRLSDDDPTTDAWFASEFLRVGAHEYFAAANSDNNGIEIREMTWTGVTSFTLSTPSVTAVPIAAEGSEPRPGVTTLGNGQGGVVVKFRVLLPSAMRADVSIYDIVGRRIRNLHTGDLAEGATVIAWDKKDDAGRELGAGVYFVRLRTALGVRSAKAAVLR
jgi:hypothetical protein